MNRNKKKEKKEFTVFLFIQYTFSSKSIMVRVSEGL